MEDREGLKSAYALGSGVYTAGDTLYVAGTKSLRDAWDDLKIPFGQTGRSQRYSDASRTLKAMPQIKRVVGHSLGGAVALELQKKNAGLKSVTYGAPVTSISGGERYRHLGDPVAALDFGANTSVPGGLNPHSYETMAARRHEFAKGTTMDGYRNGDNSLSLYR